MSLLNTAVHEGSSVETIVGNVSANGEANVSYELLGNNSGDFKINQNGEIKINQSLDYSSKSSYALTLKVKGSNDVKEVPLTINIGKNLEPNFETTCINSCALMETADSGVVILNSSELILTRMKFLTN